MSSCQKNSKHNGYLRLRAYLRSSFPFSVATDGHEFEHEKSFNVIPEKMN